MSTNKLLFLVKILLLCTTSWASDYPSLGQEANDLAQHPEWNLTITPDGKNLPQGQGTAAEGKIIFANKCSQCHGPEAIGGSAEPLVGEVGSLNSTYPEKTVNSYWPYATTLFDYLRRAMPINEPFSLKPHEIYALCAYILSQDDIIKPDFQLNEKTLPLVKMPNRDGFTPIYPE
jgi:cytochrome c